MKGFTLFETLVVIVISTLMLIVLGNFYLNFNKAVRNDGSLMAVAGGAANVIQGAEKLVLPASRILTSHTFAVGTFSSNASTLVVEIPSIDATGNQISNAYDYGVLYVQGTNANLVIEKSASSVRVAQKKLLTGALGSLTFTYNDASTTLATLVTVDVVASTSIKEGLRTTHLTEQLNLRNH